MPIEIIWIVRLIEVSILLVGSFIVYLAVKGYRRAGSTSLLYLAAGFLMLMTGSIIEGILYEFLSVDLLQAHLVEGLFELGGFISILYSIYIR